MALEIEKETKERLTMTLLEKATLAEQAQKAAPFTLTDRKAINFVERCIRNAKSSVGKFLMIRERSNPHKGLSGTVKRAKVKSFRPTAKAVYVEYSVTLKLDDGSQKTVKTGRLPR